MSKTVSDIAEMALISFELDAEGLESSAGEDGDLRISSMTGPGLSFRKESLGHGCFLVFLQPNLNDNQGGKIMYV